MKQNNGVPTMSKTSEEAIKEIEKLLKQQKMSVEQRIEADGLLEELKKSEMKNEECQQTKVLINNMIELAKKEYK